MIFCMCFAFFLCSCLLSLRDPPHQIRVLHARAVIRNPITVPVFSALRLLYIVLQPNNDLRDADIASESELLRLLSTTGVAKDFVVDSEDDECDAQAGAAAVGAIQAAFLWEGKKVQPLHHPVIVSALRIVRAYVSEDVVAFGDAVAKCVCVHQLGLVELFSNEIRKYFLTRLLRSHVAREAIAMSFVAESLTLGLHRATNARSLLDDFAFHPESAPLPADELRIRVLTDVCTYLQPRAVLPSSVESMTWQLKSNASGLRLVGD